MAEKKLAKNQAYKFKFSFVMPVYNVEQYLDEAVQSILKQKMDFRRNCEIIFVNDGSADGSEEICLKYKNKYPHNIKYIKQKNKGVAGARNSGMKSAEGKYISFFDSDDKLSSNTTNEVYDFFESNYDVIDIVSIKIEYFGAKEGGHYRNTAFDKGNRVIDLNSEYKDPLVMGARLFFKNESLVNKYEFDEKLPYIEDVLLIQGVLLRTMAYGVVAAPTYYYRQRFNGSQETKKQYLDQRYYTSVPERFYKNVISQFGANGVLPKYIQYVLANDIVWRIVHNEPPGILDDTEVNKYKSLIYSALRYVDDSVIMDEHPGLKVRMEHRLFALEKKHEKRLRKNLQFNPDNGEITIFDSRIGKVSNTKVTFEFIYKKGDHVYIEGWHNGFVTPNSRLQLTVDNDCYEVEYDDQRIDRDEYWFGEKFYRGNTFVAKIPYDKNVGKCIKPKIRINKKVITCEIGFGFFSGINWMHNGSYKVSDGAILLHIDGGIAVRKYSLLAHAMAELKYLLKIAKRGKLQPLYIRILFYLCKPYFSQKHVWLMCDRPYSTGDNAYYLFKYASAHATKKQKIYFALNKSHSRFKEVRRFGKVLPFASLGHKLIFLNAEKVVSAYTDSFVFNVFGKDYRYYFDLYDFEYVYLQHGVLVANLDSWINKYKKNMSLIIASSEREKQSIVETKSYGYTEKQVIVAGQARFDGLISNPQGKVIFMPSWRTFLRGSDNRKNGIQLDLFGYNPFFKESEYYKFYNSLINDARIRKALKNTGLKGEFYIHPALAKQASDFDGNDEVDIMTPLHDYEKAMTQANMMVTDYSGVAFDFAYMKKPLIYAQFDKEKFFNEHYHKGYYSFDEDGFGPVTVDYESTVKAIVEMIKNGCNMDQKYIKKVDAFFKYKDQNNSRRIYTELIEREVAL